MYFHAVSPLGVTSVLVFVALARLFQDPERAETVRVVKSVIMQLIQNGYSAEKTLEIIQMYVDTKSFG
jgi:hypothetical protein